MREGSEKTSHYCDVVLKPPLTLIDRVDGLVGY